MLLTEVCVKNFRVYAGEHSLKLLAPTPGHNVYLVGGMNGAGKTSLLQAIVLGLFGEQAVGLLFDRGSEELSKVYRTYVQECYSWARPASERVMTVMLSMSYEHRDVRLQRDWWFDRDGSFEDESLTIYDGGQPLHIEVDSEGDRVRILQEYIEGIAPARVGKFFFFDGEEIRDIADRDPDLSVVEGLNQLLGFDALARLIEDLQTLRATVRRGLPGASESGLTEAVLQAEEIRRQLLAARADVTEATRSHDAMRRQLALVEQELATMFDGRAVQNRSEALDALGGHERELASIAHDIQMFVAEVLTLTLPAALAERAAKRTRREAASRRIREAKSRIRPLRDALADYVLADGASRLKPGQVQSLRKRFSEAWAQLVESGEKQEALLKVFTTEELEAVPGAIAEARATARRELAARLARRTHIQSEIRRLRRIQGMFDTGSRAQEMLERKSSLLRLILEQEASMQTLGKLIEGLEQDLAAKSGVVSRLEVEVLNDDEVRAELDVIRKIESATEAFMRELRSRRAAGLAEKATDMMRRLAHKDDLVERVVIDEGDFRIRLEGAGGQELLNPSAGEREVFALSLVWALAQISNCNLPMIIDTPLGRLDQVHRARVVTEFLPVAAEQVIVLSTDAEIDGRWYEQLKPFIVQEALIEYSDETHSSSLIAGRYLDLESKAEVRV